MKISYSTGHTTYTALGDESDRSALVESFAPEFEAQMQETPLARATTPKLNNRGNVACSLALTITITYATRDAALAAVATLAGAFSASVHLKVEQGSTVHYYPNAVLRRFKPVLTGVSIRHEIAWRTQIVTATAPTTDPV